AGCVGPGRQWEKHRGLKRTPPAAMNEHRERSLVVVLRGKQIDRPAYGRAVSDRKLGVGRRRTIGRAVSLPTCKYFRMLGHPCAIVVFNFVIKGHSSSRSSFRARPSFAPGSNNVIS